ncbi:hypothetical protein HII36_45275 [Nonomuraea sp. NN258]|uniref:aKG-HExxH-type peptide beta-hydroxylase n=1 Tax=Nonomuraea antri TaxID=2730852 RepID=UPI00156A2C20|nr:HEXXH motif-containing putative peptide modification protein [Nonomuraea antri]NRQ38986.1 hypothetical protein [Nonomuraea antri]
MASDESDPASLGVVPSAADAAAAKRRLGRATLDSAAAVVSGLADRCGGVPARQALDALRRLQAVEPVFYEWYFRSLGMMRRGDWATLARHVDKLPAVAAVPLAVSGALDVRHGEPLAVTVPDDRRLLLSERVACGSALSALRPGQALVTTDGATLRIEQADAAPMELPLRDLVRCSTVAVPGAPITFWQASPALDRIVTDYQRDLSRIHLDPRPFKVLQPSEVGRRQVERFAGGLDLIRRCRPELHAEICTLTDHFTLIRGEPFIGGSAISCLGVSFFKLNPEWSDLCYADHIVHEAAHQRLHVEFEVEPALTNGAFLGSVSPIRRDPRPLHGVLHATFVFLRLSLFLRSVLEVEPSQEAERRFHRHVMGLYAGLEQLDRYGEWTGRGARLFAAMCESADRLRQIVAVPDPDFYNSLGPDYEPVGSLAAAYHD